MHAEREAGIESERWMPAASSSYLMKLALPPATSTAPSAAYGKGVLVKPSRVNGGHGGATGASGVHGRCHLRGAGAGAAVAASGRGSGLSDPSSSSFPGPPGGGSQGGLPSGVSAPLGAAVQLRRERRERERRERSIAGQGASTSTTEAVVGSSPAAVLPTAFFGAGGPSKEAADAVNAAVAAGKYGSLSSRELNEALQYLGSGRHWRAVFDIFDSLCAAAAATAEGAGPANPVTKEQAKGQRRGEPQRASRAPNSHVATTVLSIAGRRGELDRVRSIFQWMRSQGGSRSAPTAYTYTAYIQVGTLVDQALYPKSFNSKAQTLDSKP